MKRKLSLLLALVMILSLVPMSAFASSSNNVSKVPKVDEEKSFTLSDAPKLRIEEDTNGDIKVNDVFRLTLDGSGAEWNYSDGDVVTNAVYSDGVAVGDIQVEVITDTILEVTVLDVANASETTRIDVPMFVALDGTGEAKVTIDPRDTVISAGTYTYAVSSDGATVVTVAKSKTIRRGDARLGAEFVIDETVAGSLKPGRQLIELELPEGFEWDQTTTVALDARFGAGAAASIELKGDTDGDWAKDTDEPSFDAEVLVVEFTINAAAGAYDNGSRRSITVTPIIDVTRDADLGEVEVDIKKRDGEITAEKNILVAEYKDYAVELSIEDDEVKEFYAGRVDEDYITAEISLSEDIANSIIRNRVIEFKLPEWVQLADDVNITDTDSTGASLTYKGLADVTTDTSVFEMELTGGTGSAREIKFELPLTVEANKTGDIELTVSGAGIEEQTIVVAKAVAPVEVEIQMADVKVGLQNQAAPDIIIKEVAPGALQEDSYLSLEFNNDYDMTFEDAEFEVVSGDIKLDLDKSGIGENSALKKADADKTIDIYIDRDSDEKAAVIKVTGIKISLDRSVPEGPFKLNVKGDAIVENAAYNDGDFTGNFLSVQFANVITKASTDFHATSKFVIGKTTYNVLKDGVEVEKTMDVAPFISADGRTLLPVRYMANAVGLTDNDVMWNDATRTVTLFGDKVVQITIDSNMLLVNGTAVPMDTAAVIKDGRTFLPARFIAQALGFTVEWDAQDQVVTIEK